VQTTLVRMGRVAVALVLLLGGWMYGPSWSGAGDEPKGTAELRKDLAVYLGCGDVEGGGTVVQLDRSGKVLGLVRLSATPYGLAARKEGLVAALPGRGAGSVVTIDTGGKVETLLQDVQTLPAPINVAVHPVSGDVLIADNQTDVLVLLPAGDPSKRRTVLQIKGYERQLQDMSVAFTKDEHLLFGGSGPEGMYRFRGDKDATLGEPLLPDRGGVAADPTSKRWVAALRDELHVFEESREVVKLPYPQGKSKWHDTLAFTPDGTLVVALHLGQNGYDVVVADFKAKDFNRLFSWDASRIVSLAVGPKMDWK
jgi:DNA-binding beta-propeller fold protein YncE